MGVDVVGPKRLMVAYWPVEKLKAYERNARTHPERQLKELEASIREFGFNVPVLIDASGVLVAGHGRVMAAKRLGMKEVPAIDVSHMTAAQIRAYRLADNRIALNAEWDDDLLADELTALAADLDLALLGFEDKELPALAAREDGHDKAGAQRQLKDGYSFSVIIEVRDEREQARLIERFEAEGFQCRPLML